MVAQKNKKEQIRLNPPPPTGYSFVMAGNLYSSFGGYSIYIKYKDGPKNKIKIKDYTGKYIWLICPDREIIIVNNNQETGAFYPYGESFDLCIDFNTFNDYVCTKMGIEYVMTNYAHDGKCKGAAYRSQSTVPDGKRVQLLSDSGGLQLIRGLRDFIDPAVLMQFYNDNVDAGMALDLPLRFSDEAVTRRVATMQRNCNRIMLRDSKGPELINIFHGYTKREYDIYREIAEDPRITRCALASTDRQSIISGTDSIYDLIENGGVKYKQHHMLGIYLSAYMPVLIKIANSGDMPHITSDSTSHIQSAMNKAYHFQFDMYHNMKRIPIGTRATVPNTLRHFPCQCPICKNLKYMDILGFLPNAISMELLAIHNGIEMARYCNSLQEVCRQASPRDYNNLVMQQLKKHGELRHVKMALDYVDIATTQGTKHARKKYGNFTNQRKVNPKSVVRKGLFEEKVDETSIRKQLFKTLKAMEACIKAVQ